MSPLIVNTEHNDGTKVLTISVAAYNAEGWLGRCLESLVKTSVSSALEVIVVNDGSEDGTLKVAQSYEAEYPNVVRVVDKENGGHGSTINTAIGIARGKYFKIVDSDDWVEKDGMEQLVRALAKADCDLALNPFYVVNAETGAKRLADDIFEGDANPIGSAVDVDRLSGRLGLVMHAMTFKTKLLQDSPCRLDEHCFYVDNEYIVYYFAACETVMLLNWPVYDYLLGTSEQSMNFSNMIKRRGQHEKVCLACARFYSGHPELSGRREQVVRSCTYRMLSSTYRILACLPYELSNREMRVFDQEFRNASPNLYEGFLDNGPEGAVTRVVRKLRTRGFRRYRAINLLYRVKYHCLGEDVEDVGKAK